MLTKLEAEHLGQTILSLPGVPIGAAAGLVGVEGLAPVPFGTGMERTAPHLHLAFLPANESPIEWDVEQFEQVT